MPNLNEETVEGAGLRGAMNLGSKIAKTMNNKAFQPKKNIRAGGSVSPKLPRAGKSSASVITNHRYRRYFGIRPPGAPY